MPLTPSPAIGRACDVLEELSRNSREPLTVSEIARRTGMPRATADAVLLALAQRGLVVRNDENRRYSLGPTCIAFGEAARLANTALSAAAAEAEQLAKQTTSCIAVVTREGDEARVAMVFDFGPPFGVRTRVGQSIPLVPPLGAVFVAWEEASLVDRWLDQPGLGVAERRRDRRALAEVRERGYSVTVATARRVELGRALDSLAEAPDSPELRDRRDQLIREMSHSEYFPTAIDDASTVRVSQMSAPVFDRTGRVSVAIMALGADYEVTSKEINDIGDKLCKAADRATRLSGGRSPDSRP